jgi:hypothetical protein
MWLWLQEQQLQQRMCVLRDEGVILPVTVLEAVSSGGDFDEPGLRVEYKMSGSLRVPGFIPASLLKVSRDGCSVTGRPGRSRCVDIEHLVLTQFAGQLVHPNSLFDYNCMWAAHLRYTDRRLVLM